MADPMSISDTIPSPGDIEGITQASRDYIESWYSADAERMRRCVHPALVKRTLEYDEPGNTWLLHQPTTAERMVEHRQCALGKARRRIQGR